jgi:uncharacterized protein (DUF488 family)
VDILKMDLYTIGHSTQTIEHFLSLIEQHAIRVLVDVRSTPASRFHPQFGQRRLEASLAGAGIRYEYLGQALGGRAADPSVYPDGLGPTPGERPPRQPDYALVMQRSWFIDGVRRLIEIAGSERTAILCSEEDPARCHRQSLIAVYLAGSTPDVHVWHIRGSGALEDARLLGE